MKDKEIEREGGRIIEDLGCRGQGRRWRLYEGNGMRSPLRVEGKDEKNGGDKGQKVWRPRTNAPSSMGPGASKLE